MATEGRREAGIDLTSWAIWFGLGTCYFQIFKWVYRRPFRPSFNSILQTLVMPEMYGIECTNDIEQDWPQWTWIFLLYV